jgi:hypothetical protein
MSVTKEYLNKKWIDWTITILISVITILTTANLKMFGSLASKNYVDKGDLNNKQLFDKEIDNVRREQQISNESIFKLLQIIDKRTERVEDRINKNFDK